MVILGFLVGALVVGALLYLPFFVWFRWRRPPSLRRSPDVNFTPAGWVLLVAQLVVMLGGLFAGNQDPGHPLASLVSGNAGLLTWWICVSLAFGAIHRLARGAGIALERTPAAVDAPPAGHAPRGGTRGFRLATLAGVPVTAQLSFFFSGALIALVAGVDVEGIVGYCLAYAGLFAVHEFGHALVARQLGLRVYSVVLSGAGGYCRLQLPRRTRDIWLVYAAGLVAQALLLLLTLASVAWFGMPESHAGMAVVTTFTWVNALVFAINLMPGRTRSGLPTDGSILWGLARHVFGDAPHPLAAQHAASPLFDPATRLLTVPGLLPEGFCHGIEMLNDDTTPMDFVIAMLQAHAGLDADAAMATMLQIHTRGGLLVPLADRAQADAAADTITREARARGHRLVCRAVSAGA